jgi:hypothetical protein
VDFHPFLAGKWP